MKKILIVIAHPDDEAFFFGGTLAKYTDSGVEINLLCATRGEGNREVRSRKEEARNRKKVDIGDIREKELLRSAKILGIKKVEFLDFIDGTLCNAIYHQIADKIIKKINDFKPQVVLTNERRGISGHLDHIAISMITTYAYLRVNSVNKLYYYCLSKEIRESMSSEYFIYFPEGYEQKEITTRIDYMPYWSQKVKAMLTHKSQIKDAKALVARFETRPKVDHFILQYHRGIKVELPETDLFAGIMR